MSSGLRVVVLVCSAEHVIGLKSDLPVGIPSGHRLVWPDSRPGHYTQAWVYNSRFSSREEWPAEISEQKCNAWQCVGRCVHTRTPTCTQLLSPIIWCRHKADSIDNCIAVVKVCIFVPRGAVAELKKWGTGLFMVWIHNGESSNESDLH